MSSRPFGAIVDDDGVLFSTWAPAQATVALAIEGERERPMVRDDDAVFTLRVPTARAGQRYRFRLAQGLRPDPASRFQPDGPLGPSQIVDPRAFAWTDQDWEGAGPGHAHVLYELHIGTFTAAGTWNAAIARLSSLVDIGVTTIEVMPIAEFAGRFGWGYDGVNLFAPSHLYGSPDDARRFVNEAHRHGLAVILDVVYNHFGPVGNFIREFAPNALSGPGEWGDVVSYDRPGSRRVRELMTANAVHWIADYHFDGLRLDATQAIVDRSERHIVSDICRAARTAAGARTVFLAGESEPQDVRLLRHGGVYADGLDALWSEDWHHAAHVVLTGRRQAYFSDYQGSAAEFAAMARHGTLYQGQWYSWQRAPRGRRIRGVPVSSFVNFLENHDQIANTGTGARLYQSADAGRWRALTALLLLGPALPMLFQGQEFGSTRPFTYFADHQGELGEAVAAGRLEFLSQFAGLAAPEMRARLPRPDDEASFRAGQLDDEERRADNAASRLHRDLIALRRRDVVLSRLGTSDVDVDSSAPDAALLLLRYCSDAADRLLIVNLGDDHVAAMNDPLFAPAPEREWAVQWSSEHPDYGGSGSESFTGPGRWRIPGRSAVLLGDRR